MPTLYRRLVVAGLFIVSSWQLPALRAVDDAKTAGSRPRERAVSKAVDFLRQKGQADDGSFSRQTGPAVTALVTTALVRNGLSLKDPMVAKALKYLEGFVQEDGGIYRSGSTHQ